MTQKQATPRSRAKKDVFLAGVNPHWVAAIFIFAFAVTMVSFPAYADDTPMSIVLCKILSILQGGGGQGSAGRAMGTLGILSIGIAALMGKASWGLAITVGVGIGTVIGAKEIIEALGLGLASCPNEEDVLLAVLHYYA